MCKINKKLFEVIIILAMIFAFDCAARAAGDYVTVKKTLSENCYTEIEEDLTTAIAEETSAIDNSLAKEDQLSTNDMKDLNRKLTKSSLAFIGTISFLINEDHTVTSNVVDEQWNSLLSDFSAIYADYYKDIDPSENIVTAVKRVYANVLTGLTSQVNGSFTNQTGVNDTLESLRNSLDDVKQLYDANPNNTDYKKQIANLEKQINKYENMRDPNESKSLKIYDSYKEFVYFGELPADIAE